jgi:hypothetical protein
MRAARPLGFARLVLRRRSDGKLIYASPLLMMHLAGDPQANFSLARLFWSLRDAPRCEEVVAEWQVDVPFAGGEDPHKSFPRWVVAMSGRDQHVGQWVEAFEGLCVGCQKPPDQVARCAAAGIKPCAPGFQRRVSLGANILPHLSVRCLEDGSVEMRFENGTIKSTAKNVTYRTRKRASTSITEPASELLDAQRLASLQQSLPAYFQGKQ